MKTLLTFDLEEFDSIKERDFQFEISRQGLLPLLELLSKYNINTTFFTTAEFASHYPKLLQNLEKQGHEIACHGYSHSDKVYNQIEKAGLAKQEIESIIKKEIHGFRAPRFQIKNIHKLTDFGFSYDSSIHPTFIPGRYMNLHKKRGIHKIGNIIEIPPSTLPLCRLPIFWLAFKNLGKPYIRTFTKINSRFSDYQMLVFHPWEFADLEQIKIPRYMKRKHSRQLLNLLEYYICLTKDKYGFDTVSNYLNSKLL